MSSEIIGSQLAGRDLPDRAGKPRPYGTFSRNEMRRAAFFVDGVRAAAYISLTTYLFECSTLE